MSQVFITGDIHGSYEIQRLSGNKWLAGKDLSKDDYLIICGDFGLLWKQQRTKEESYWLSWLEDRSWTTLFIDGNHENHSLLRELPIKDFLGGKVGVVNDSVYHLRRGEIYTINGKTFFCFGGAISIDRSHRLLNVSYWEEEVPSSKEMEYASKNLEKHQYTVDYVVTHTAPETIIHMIHHPKEDYVDPTSRFLNFISSNVKCQKWYCGHLHMDKDILQYSILWNRILKIF